MKDRLLAAVTALQFYDSRRIDLSGSWPGILIPGLATPSLVTIGYGDGVNPVCLSSIAFTIARAGLVDGRAVAVTSGRDDSATVEADCLVGSVVRQRLARERPRSDDPDLDAKKYLGVLVEPGPSLVVHGVDSDVGEGVHAVAAQEVVDLWVFDDVHGVASALALSKGSPTLDVSPTGLRQLSRQKMAAVVVTIDWRLTDRWRWLREADHVLTVQRDARGEVALLDGCDSVTVGHSAH